MKKLVGLILALALSGVAGAQDKHSVHIVQWSDVHSGGKWISDVAWKTAATMGLAMKPQGIVLSGDFCDNSHDPDTFFARLKEGLHLVSDRLRGENEPVFLAMGNDDFQHNYQTPPAELQQSVNCFREAFGDRCYLDDMGNGISPSHLGGMNWLSVNSVFFSFKNTTPQAPEQAKKTLAWLRKQMPPNPEGSKAEAPPVVIVTHLPPTWDLFLKTPSWKPEYIREFQEIVANYPGQVFILAGHYHRNHIQAMERAGEPAVILSGGALATKYGYHSNWRDLTFRENADGKVSSVSYTVHYPENDSWNGTYRVVPAHMDEFFNTLMDSEPLYRRYVQDIFGHSKDALDQAADSKVRDMVRDQFWVHAEAPATP